MLSRTSLSRWPGEEINNMTRDMDKNVRQPIRLSIDEMVTKYA